MTTKTVYQVDAHFWYVGETKAFACELEPGTFHVPAGCVEVAPPWCADGWRARWVGGTWIREEWAPPVPPTPQELLAAFLQANPEVLALVNIAPQG